MATSLLLEGDDLEALLARARAEGGPHARIVRAEKLRHGGVLGFFAKEKFEVALEIPDEFRTPAPQEEPMSQPAPTPVVVAPAGGGALDRLTRRLTAAAEDPEVAAREGLLGLAQRADAVELAAARAVQPAVPDAVDLAAARPAGSTQRDVPDALDLALRKLLDPEPASALAAAGATSSPVHPSTSRPEFTALLDQLLVPTLPADAALAVVPGPRPSDSVPAPRPAPRPAPQPASEPAPAPAPAFTPPAPSAPTPASTSVPPAYREVSLPPAPPAHIPPTVGAYTESAAAAYTESANVRPTGRTAHAGEGRPNRDRREDPQLAADRTALRALGVPTSWTRALRPGDRFTAVLRMLDRMPEVDIDPRIRIVAVVGPASSVVLEAHRTALDLPTETAGGPAPRPVVHVPAAGGAERAAALTEARLIGDVVVAIEADPADTGRAVEALHILGAGAVVAIVGADSSVERAQAFLDALGQVDALVVEGTGGSTQPAAVLQLGLPVVRLDGIPVDRYTWTAVLLGRLDPVPGR